MDAIRGFAALCVVLFHSGDALGFASPRSAYIAVDIFFVLSGFVIAAAYERRLKEGMTVKQFVYIRFVRLYPLYALALAIAIAVPIGSLVLSGRISEHSEQSWYAFPYALAALPYPFSGTGTLYPLNVAAWSLLFEGLANLIYALTYRYWTYKVLLITIFSAGMIILVNGGYDDTGWTWDSFHFGLLRVWYSFPLGVLLYRLYSDGYRLPSTPTVFSIVILILLMYITNDTVRLCGILVVSPVLVALAATAQSDKRAISFYASLGMISYAVYIIHAPFGALFFTVLGNLPFSLPQQFAAIVYLLMVLAVCWFASTCYDHRIRSWLLKKGEGASSGNP